MANRLNGESSLYLRQHADNPVHWFPWGDDAFAAARASGRPILLSIGYSACHWCHVMAHESFEDEASAAVMNELFVNVKVDREERPDVDATYMTAVQAMTGHGGWPLTVFLTPTGEPFWGGTYFPPEPRHGMPAFRQVLHAVAEAWRTKQDEVVESAASLGDLIRRSSLLREPATPDTSILDDAATALLRAFDREHGGFGRAPKFPQPMAIEFLLRTHARTGAAEPLALAQRALLRMARGGIFDQVGGGFHRYSTDAHWLVPHFEKMLYDNALLAQLYVAGWQATHEEELKDVALRTLGYVAREMTLEGGAFAAAQDADSEGEEGRFYVWDARELDRLLGEDAALARRVWGVTDGGNFEGQSILHVAVAPDSADERDRLDRARQTLYEARATRVWPARDDKVITAWNAHMITAFARAGVVFDRPDLIKRAVVAADFIFDNAVQGGRLHRVWNAGRATVDAFLEDHAVLGDACLAVWQATADPRWYTRARQLADTILERFHDPDPGLFFDASADSTLVARPRHVDDNPIASGNSAATVLLLRLAALDDEPRYAEAARRVLEDMGGLMRRAPLGFTALLGALDFHLAPPRELALAAESVDALRVLQDVASERYRPNLSVAVTTARSEDGDVGPALLRGRHAPAAGATAWLCERFACRAPVHSPDALRATLDEATGSQDA